MKGFKDSTKTQRGHNYAKGGRVSFNEAFRSNRNAGKKTFEWNGKRYTTELAEPKTSAPNPATARTPPQEDRSTPYTMSRAMQAEADARPGPKGPSVREVLGRRSGPTQAESSSAAARRGDAIGGALKSAADFVTKGDGREWDLIGGVRQALAKGGSVGRKGVPAHSNKPMFGKGR